MGIGGGGGGGGFPAIFVWFGDGRSEMVIINCKAIL